MEHDGMGQRGDRTAICFFDDGSDAGPVDLLDLPARDRADVRGPRATPRQAPPTARPRLRCAVESGNDRGGTTRPRDVARASSCTSGRDAHGAGAGPMNPVGEAAAHARDPGSRGEIIEASGSVRPTHSVFRRRVGCCV